MYIEYIECCTTQTGYKLLIFKSTLSTTITLTPQHNVKTHETTTKIKWKIISCMLNSSTHYFIAMFRQIGCSLGLPDKEFVGSKIAIKDCVTEHRVWKYFFFFHQCFKTLCTQNLVQNKQDEHTSTLIVTSESRDNVFTHEIICFSSILNYK